MLVVKLTCVLGLCAIASAQSDGNPHGWDRKRRCDWDYEPACRGCEGIGGIARSNAKDDIDLTTCKVVSEKSQVDEDMLVRPKWGTQFTLRKGYHETLIGKKLDPFCFQSFPGPDSTGPLCYRFEEGSMYYDAVDTKSIKLELETVQIFKHLPAISSSLIHQGTNMWIANTLWFGIEQCLCFTAVPDVEAGVRIRPHIHPLQYNWLDKAEFVAVENIGLEFLKGNQNATLNHWVLGPHHVWADRVTGDVIRMWQPFNGLEVLDQSTRVDKVNPKDLADIPPSMCKKGGALFRINCDDKGYPKPCGPQNKYCQDNNSTISHPDPSTHEMYRAVTKVPRPQYKGSSFDQTAKVLNEHLVKHFDTKSCEEWTAEQLQQLQLILLLFSHKDFDEVYQRTSDSRRLRFSDPKELTDAWALHNGITDAHPRMMEMQRDGHCAEVVMWFIHHLTDASKELANSGLAIPRLSPVQHSCPPDANEHERAVCAKYKEQVTCATCHSDVTYNFDS